MHLFNLHFRISKHNVQDVDCDEFSHTSASLQLECISWQFIVKNVPVNHKRGIMSIQRLLKYTGGFVLESNMSMNMAKHKIYQIQ